MPAVFVAVLSISRPSPGPLMAPLRYEVWGPSSSLRDASLFLIRQFHQYPFWELVVMLFMPPSATMGILRPRKVFARNPAPRER